MLVPTRQQKESMIKFLETKGPVTLLDLRFAAIHGTVQAPDFDNTKDWCDWLNKFDCLEVNKIDDKEFEILYIPEHQKQQSSSWYVEPRPSGSHISSRQGEVEILIDYDNSGNYTPISNPSSRFMKPPRVPHRPKKINETTPRVSSKAANPRRFINNRSVGASTKSGNSFSFRDKVASSSPVKRSAGHDISWSNLLCIGNGSKNRRTGKKKINHVQNEPEYAVYRKTDSEGNSWSSDDVFADEWPPTAGSNVQLIGNVYPWKEAEWPVVRENLTWNNLPSLKPSEKNSRSEIESLKIDNSPEKARQNEACRGTGSNPFTWTPNKISRGGSVLPSEPKPKSPRVGKGARTLSQQRKRARESTSPDGVNSRKSLRSSPLRTNLSNESGISSINSIVPDINGFVLIGDHNFLNVASNKLNCIYTHCGLNNSRRKCGHCLSALRIHEARKIIDRMDEKVKNVVINIGATDIAENRNLTKMKNSYNELLKACDRKKIRIVATTIPVVGNLTANEKSMIESFNNFIRCSVAMRYPIIDLYYAIKGDALNTGSKSTDSRHIVGTSSKVVVWDKHCVGRVHQMLQAHLSVYGVKA